jgi:hypothetical protein
MNEHHANLTFLLGRTAVDCTKENRAFPRGLTPVRRSMSAMAIFRQLSGPSTHEVFPNRSVRSGKLLNGVVQASLHGRLLFGVPLFGQFNFRGHIHYTFRQRHRTLDTGIE